MKSTNIISIAEGSETRSTQGTRASPDFSRYALNYLTIIQCNPDLVTSYLVTNPDLVTILQKTIFLIHKNISFSDNLVFSAPSI